VTSPEAVTGTGETGLSRSPIDAEGAPESAVAAALSADGPIAREHPGYVVRDGQLALAGAVAGAIDRQSRLVVEAGTGTGKTFSYLVPALLSGAKVLISTGTRTLQDQLFSRDLPELARALGVRVETALLKGRSNYVCWHHLQRNLADGRFARREDIAQLHRIQRFAVVSPSGDRSDFPGVPEDAPAWSMATSTRENCLGQECAEFARCFVFKARQAAQRADLVVVNHHLFCADLALRDDGVADLLPSADALIFDEAHQLPEVATQFFGRSVSSRRLLDFARDTLRVGLAEARDAADWTQLSQNLEQAIRELRLHAGPPGRIDASALRERAALLAAVEGCEKKVASCGAALDAAASRGRDLPRCALRAAELLDELRRWRERVVGEPTGGAPALPAGHAPGSLDTVPGGTGAGQASGEPGEAFVTWAEVHASGVALNATPLSVAGVFRRHFESRPRAWVFLSATLAVGGDFAHFVRTMGLDDASVHVWESPFDFQSQGLLYVPEGLGEPSGPDFPDRVFRAAWPLVVANGGRAFLLCTTLRMVDRLAGLARAAIAAESSPIELLVQGQASRAELLERFRQHPNPLLIGSASFWEGVDVPGQQLSLVVIDKLPFAPPDDPVLRARIESARRDGIDPFRSMQLPAAAMSLKQGAGRLIRSERDRGVLMVCDRRLAERNYGRWLLRSLPPFRRTRSQAQALEFLGETGTGDTSRVPVSPEGSAAQ
jgi:ATP-dependent DNA helicase DinG